jgi:hypothetical protein
MNAVEENRGRVMLENWEISGQSKVIQIDVTV